MKENKTWIIVAIMGLALTISIIYSIILNHKINNIEPEKIVTSTSIVQAKVTRVSIENTLTGNGKIIKDESNNVSDIIDEQGNVVGKLTNEKEAKINLTVEKNDKEKLKESLDIIINEKDSDKKYNGVISKVEEISENTFNITVTFEEDMLLENDTVVQCKVTLEKADDVIAVPVEAVQTNGQSQKYVTVINEDGTTIETIVETGISDPFYIEITKGLNGGEKIQLTTSTTVTTNKDENQTK